MLLLLPPLDIHELSPDQAAQEREQQHAELSRTGCPR